MIDGGVELPVDFMQTNNKRYAVFSIRFEALFTCFVDLFFLLASLSVRFVRVIFIFLRLVVCAYVRRWWSTSYTNRAEWWTGSRWKQESEAAEQLCMIVNVFCPI